MSMKVKELVWSGPNSTPHPHCAAEARRDCNTCGSALYRNGVGGPCKGCVDFSKWAPAQVDECAGEQGKTTGAFAQVAAAAGLTQSEGAPLVPMKCPNGCGDPVRQDLEPDPEDNPGPEWKPYKEPIERALRWERVGSTDDRPTFRISAVSDGSTASYYELPADAKELQDLIAYRDMNAQMGEIFRACYRYGQVAHNPKVRDIKKIIFYAQAELARLEKYGEGKP